MYASKLFVQRLLLLMVTGQWLLQLWMQLKQSELQRVQGVFSLIYWISDACAKGCTDLQSPRR